MDKQSSRDALVRFVRTAHKGQKDKCGFDYFETHLLPVARSVPANLYCAALAHDILEDTDTTADDLKDAGFCAYEVELIQILTNPVKDYADYLNQIANNRDAKIIKVMDIVNNLSRIHNVEDEETSARLVKKYLDALRHLRF